MVFKSQAGPPKCSPQPRKIGQTGLGEEGGLLCRREKVIMKTAFCRASRSPAVLRNAE